MNKTIFALALAFAEATSFNAIAGNCKSGAEREFADHIVAFEDLPDAWKTSILNLEFPEDLPPRLRPVLEKDTPTERYLKPNHPGAQPQAPDSAWCRYEKIPQAALPAEQKVPTQAFDPQEKALTDAGGGVSPFRSRPKINPPEVIDTTFVRTAEGIFPPIENQDEDPPGTNLLPTIEHNMFDANGKEMNDTIPSTKSKPYNLHDGQPVVKVINPTSPADDLRYVLETAFEIITGKPYKSLWEELSSPLPQIEQQIAQADAHHLGLKANRHLLEHLFRMAVDIIEGNDSSTSRVPGDRAYRGFPLLHHSGHLRVRWGMSRLMLKSRNRRCWHECYAALAV